MAVKSFPSAAARSRSPHAFVVFSQEFSLFGHLNIENMLNISRFESVVDALLRAHDFEQQQQQQQQQQLDKWKTPAKAKKRGGDAQGLVQVPACDSPSTDEAEVTCDALLDVCHCVCGDMRL